MSNSPHHSFTVKHATPDHPVHPLIANRFSPYVYDATRTVEPEKIRACFEAARWSASSYNEQPWTFLVAHREDAPEFRRMLECLLEANQAWAQHAGVLLITVVNPTFKLNGQPNRVAEHDVGLAMGNLTFQASDLGLHVHQMAGLDLDRAREVYAIPETHRPLTAAAIGYAGPPETASLEMLAQRDSTPRTRKPLRDLVYAGHWGQPSSLVSGT